MSSDIPPVESVRHLAARKHVPSSSSAQAAMEAYRAYRDRARQPFLQRYTVLGFLSSGTYGRVYSARARRRPPSETQEASDDPLTVIAQAEETGEEMYAIKKFKPDKETDHPPVYTGISQSAMREIALNRELRHENIVRLREVMLEDKAIYMVFSYADHDFLQLIHHHSTVLRIPIPLSVLKSLLYQLLQGVAYLHANWVLHRDLKPANILVTAAGQVKIGDLGLARVYSAPLLPLYNADKVVVTIWYRAPELLLGARHYTPAIDLWAVGCIWGELLALRPMFKGEEAKMDPKTKAAPFQTDQLTRIVEILGTPTPERWPAITSMPDHKTWWPHLRLDNCADRLHTWYTSRSRPQPNNPAGFTLFEQLLTYDPTKRATAVEALTHPWWREAPVPTPNAFQEITDMGFSYPSRRMLPLATEGADASMAPTAAQAKAEAAAAGAHAQAQAQAAAAAKAQAAQAQLAQAAQAAQAAIHAAAAAKALQEAAVAGTGQLGGIQTGPPRALPPPQPIPAVDEATANDPSRILASAVANALAAGAGGSGGQSSRGAQQAGTAEQQRAAAQAAAAAMAAMQAGAGTSMGGAGSGAHQQPNTGAVSSLGLGHPGQLGTMAANMIAIPSGPPAPPPAPVSAAPSVGSSTGVATAPPSDMGTIGAGAADSAAASGATSVSAASAASSAAAAPPRAKASAKDMRSTATSNQRNKRQKMN